MCAGRFERQISENQLLPATLSERVVKTPVRLCAILAVDGHSRERRSNSGPHRFGSEGPKLTLSP